MLGLSKRCTKCERKLSIEGNFRKDKTKPDGFYSSCNDCHRKRTGAEKLEKPGNKTKNGYAMIGKRYLHRVIAEQKIRRKLRKNEVVHHINGDKLDNRWENLEVMTKFDHLKLHSKERITGRIIMFCVVCGKGTTAKPSQISNNDYRKQYLHLSCRKDSGWSSIPERSNLKVDRGIKIPVSVITSLTT